MDYNEEIKKIIASKNGRWDSSIIYNEKEIPLSYFIFNYAKSIETLTNNGISIEFIINKLSENLDTLRFRNFQTCDEDFMYDEISVVDSKYIEIRQNFGAQVVNDNQHKNALVIYDKESSKSGIDFNSIEDISQTLYHEFTHIMSITKTEDPEEVEINGRIFINSEDGYNHGISTLEKMPNGQVFHNEHNKIDEGFVEYIAWLITTRVLNIEATSNNDRYKYEVFVAKSIMEIYGESNTITDYLTNPGLIIQRLESINIDNQTDGLHFLGDIIKNKEFITQEEAFKYVKESLQILNKDKDNRER